MSDSQPANSNLKDVVVQREVEPEPRHMSTYYRPLSDNELSYFLPSRADGVNDMFLHIGFRAPAHLVTPTRIATAWAIIRLRHQLLASSVQMNSGAYDSARFQYTPPSSPDLAIQEAQRHLELRRDVTAEERIHKLLNDTRVLSSSRLSYLAILTHEDDQEFDLIINVAHFVGDGVGTHLVGNLFFTLLGGSPPSLSPSSTPSTLSSPTIPMTDAQLSTLLDTEWRNRWGKGVPSPGEVFPQYAEGRLNAPKGRLQEAAWKVDFRREQGRLIGGHVFPRTRGKSRQTVSDTHVIDVESTRAILASCKREGVTIQQALFALCNFAWIRTSRARATGAERQREKEKLPMMFYTAINFRPYMPPSPLTESYLFLAVAYFNVVLPSFLPSNDRKSRTVFWDRARSVRAQSRKYLTSGMLGARTLIMSEERGKRARKFAKEDDDALLRPSLPFPSTAVPSPPPPPTTTATQPSFALLGLSQMGNLDPCYNALLYPSITLSRLTAHTRKSPGGMLLFTYTFRGRLCVSLGWDKAGFEEGCVEAFWEGVKGGAGELLAENIMGNARARL